MFNRDLFNLQVREYDSILYHNIGKNLLTRGFTCLGSGSFRTTYGRGKIVIKVPRHWDGFDDNIGEAYAWRKYRNNPKEEDGIVFAPCRLLPNGCLMMVMVDVEPDYQALPKWASMLDGSQAGYYKGRVVAYDSGCDLGLDKNEALVALGLPETD